MRSHVSASLQIHLAEYMLRRVLGALPQMTVLLSNYLTIGLLIRSYLPTLSSFKRYSRLLNYFLICIMVRKEGNLEPFLVYDDTL